MSEALLIAFISVAGAIIAALITAFATIYTGQQHSKNGNPINCAAIALLASIGAGIGLVAGALFSFYLVQRLQQAETIPQTATTPIPVITSTIPTNVPVSVSRFSTLDLMESTNTWTTNLGMSAGEQTVEGIPFLVGREMTTQNCKDVTVPQTLSANANIMGIARIHFIIQAGNGWDVYSGLEIGEIHLQFQNGMTQVIDLLLGQNIRDWATDYPPVVSAVSVSYVHEVWTGTGWDGKQGRMDLMTYTLPNNLMNETLQTISLIENPSLQPSGGYSAPCIHIQAITVEQF